MKESGERAFDHLEGLNPRQREAVEHREGPILVIAGAGTGKTRVITHRIFNLIKNGVDPRSILAVTFTNKAAGEMKERIKALVEKDGTYNRPVFEESGIYLPFASTFHSLGVHILKEFGEQLGIRKHFAIFDRSDSVKAIKQSMKNVGISASQWKPKLFLAKISQAKGGGLTLEEYSVSADDFMSQMTSEVWSAYEKILKKEGALDFDDLLLKAAILLQENKEVRDHYLDRFRYIHVDEYQDTNLIQYKLSRLLTGSNNNICVVGDVDQTIYTWRGAHIGHILDFEKDYPGAVIIRLEENYRSTQNILRAANDIIQKNTLRQDKTLFTNNPKGDVIDVSVLSNEDDEASWVAEEIDRLREAGVRLSEIALLYRANFQSRALEEAMITYDIPYRVLGVRFFERKEVKDILAYIRYALNPESITDLKRIINTPRRGIGKVTLARVVSNKEDELSPALRKKMKVFRELVASIKACAQTKKPSEVVQFVLEKSGLKKEFETSKDEEDLERLENAKELATLAKKYDNLPVGEGVEKLLTDAALASDQDSIKDDEDAVRLMTIHASKGLEFDYIFITGLEQGLFPQQKDDMGVAEEEEERRLFYVALTRARKKVFLSHASIRTIFGSTHVTVPSEFLLDLDDSLINTSGLSVRGSTTDYLDLDEIEW